MICVLEINHELYDTDWIRWRSFRSEPVDTLEFEQEKVIKVDSDVSLKAQNPDAKEMQTLFKGKLQSSGYAINAPNLFTPLKPKNWRNITAYGVIRDLCTLAKLGEPVIGIKDRTLPFFQGRKNAALSFQSLLNQLQKQGDPEDASFYVDPSGQFYLGRFQNWKKQVEVLQEGENLVSWHVLASLNNPETLNIRAEVLPDANLFHSQAVQLFTALHDGIFVRCEGVKLEFDEGEVWQDVVLKVK